MIFRELHRTMVLGLRGLNVIGEPVYKGAFERQRHEVLCSYDPALPLDESIDFGKHHPCVVWRQTSPLGQVRYLGGILGRAPSAPVWKLGPVQHRDVVVRQVVRWCVPLCQ